VLATTIPDKILPKLIFFQYPTKPPLGVPPMTDQKSPKRSVPRIESIRIKNYRALRRLETKPLSPLTILLGPSGSGKSTLFDARAPFASPHLSSKP